MAKTVTDLKATLGTANTGLVESSPKVHRFFSDVDSFQFNSDYSDMEENGSEVTGLVTEDPISDDIELFKAPESSSSKEVEEDYAAAGAQTEGVTNDLSLGAAGKGFWGKLFSVEHGLQVLSMVIPALAPGSTALQLALESKAALESDLLRSDASYRIDEHKEAELLRLLQAISTGDDVSAATGFSMSLEGQSYNNLDISHMDGAPFGAKMTGNQNANKLTGGSHGDYINGLGGNDTIRGNGGNDYINGGDGNDVLYGDYGHDILIGGKGSDKLYGGWGDDQLYSGDGSIDSWGVTQMWGGTGRDGFYNNDGSTVTVHDFERYTDKLYVSTANTGATKVQDLNYQVAPNGALLVQDTHHNTLFVVYKDTGHSFDIQNDLTWKSLDSMIDFF